MIKEKRKKNRRWHQFRFQLRKFFFKPDSDSDSENLLIDDSVGVGVGIGFRSPPQDPSLDTFSEKLFARKYLIYWKYICATTQLKTWKLINITAIVAFPLHDPYKLRRVTVISARTLYLHPHIHTLILSWDRKFLGLKFRSPF